jgi:hypothetical protein
VTVKTRTRELRDSYLHRALKLENFSVRVFGNNCKLFVLFSSFLFFKFGVFVRIKCKIIFYFFLKINYILFNFFKFYLTKLNLIINTIN